MGILSIWKKWRKAMNKVNWTMVVIFTVVLVFAFIVGLSLFGGWRYSGWGMMGSGRMGPGMMGNWGFSPFGWLAMFLMWLIPVGLVVLAILGIVGLFRSTGKAGGGGTVTPARSCPNCGRGIQAEWNNCPFCGERLT
jgi:hypothetical protein